jgi:hypothetical protein
MAWGRASASVFLAAVAGSCLFAPGASASSGVSGITACASHQCSGNSAAVPVGAPGTLVTPANVLCKTLGPVESYHPGLVVVACERSQAGSQDSLLAAGVGGGGHMLALGQTRSRLDGDQVTLSAGVDDTSIDVVSQCGGTTTPAGGSCLGH